MVHYGRCGLKAAKVRADRLFSQHIRSSGLCEAEGYLFDCDGRLECAHWIPRRYSWTRTVQSNAFCICQKHHAWFTSHPDAFQTWAVEQRGLTAYKELRLRASSTVTFDWPAEAQRLEEL